MFKNNPIKEYLELTKKRKEIDKKIDAIKRELISQGHYTLVSSSRVDTGRLKEEYPEIYNSLLKSSETKRIKV